MKRDVKWFLSVLCARGLLGWLPDKQYLQLYYYGRIGKWIDFDNPKTFNEKLQWIKLYDRNPLYSTMVDKYACKPYIAGIIGEEYIVPTYGVWDSFDTIDFDALPEQFVLKTTHDSGTVCICENKKMFDIPHAREVINNSLSRNFSRICREWPYDNVPPRVMAEALLPNDSEDSTTIKDYKLFCFNGKAKFFKIDFDRNTNHHANYFDLDGSLLEFGEADYPPVPEKKLTISARLGEMVSLAEKISKDIPFLRVDFYDVNGSVYFGETTFFPAAGFGPFTPSAYDRIIGDMLELPRFN